MCACGGIAFACGALVNLVHVSSRINRGLQMQQFVIMARQRRSIADDGAGSNPGSILEEGFSLQEPVVKVLDGLLENTPRLETHNTAAA